MDIYLGCLPINSHVNRKKKQIDRQIFKTFLNGLTQKFSQHLFIYKKKRKKLKHMLNIDDTLPSNAHTQFLHTNCNET